MMVGSLLLLVHMLRCLGQQQVPTSINLTPYNWFLRKVIATGERCCYSVQVGSPQETIIPMVIQTPRKYLSPRCSFDPFSFHDSSCITSTACETVDVKPGPRRPLRRAGK